MNKIRDFSKIDFRETLEELMKDPVLAKCYYDILSNNKAFNLPYHNNIHSLAMALLMYETWIGEETWVLRTAVIAALFHDFDHSGRPDIYEPNINVAINNSKSFWPEDLSANIERAIRLTEFPYEDTNLEGKYKEDILLQIGLSIRLADHSWSNIFPIDIGSLGIYYEQFKDKDYIEFRKENISFRKNIRKSFEFLDLECPDRLEPLYNLLKLYY